MPEIYVNSNPKLEVSIRPTFGSTNKFDSWIVDLKNIHGNYHLERFSTLTEARIYLRGVCGFLDIFPNFLL